MSNEVTAKDELEGVKDSAVVDASNADRLWDDEEGSRSVDDEDDWSLPGDELLVGSTMYSSQIDVIQYPYMQTQLGLLSEFLYVIKRA